MKALFKHFPFFLCLFISSNVIRLLASQIDFFIVWYFFLSIYPSLCVLFLSMIRAFRIINLKWHIERKEKIKVSFSLMLLLAPVLYPQREMEVCQLIPKHVLCNIHTVEDRKITVCKTKKKLWKTNIFFYFYMDNTSMDITYNIPKRSKSRKTETQTPCFYLLCNIVTIINSLQFIYVKGKN